MLYSTPRGELSFPRSAILVETPTTTAPPHEGRTTVTFSPFNGPRTATSTATRIHLIANDRMCRLGTSCATQTWETVVLHEVGGMGW